MAHSATLRKEKDSFWSALIDQLTDDLRAESRAHTHKPAGKEAPTEPLKPSIDSLLFNYRLTVNSERPQAASHVPPKTRTNAGPTARPTRKPQRESIATPSAVLSATPGVTPAPAKESSPPRLTVFGGSEALVVLSRLEALGARFKDIELDRNTPDGVAICKKALHRERVRMLIRFHPDHRASADAALLLQEGIALFRRLSEIELAK